MQNVKALQKALTLRGKEAVKNCIFHSDRGSQYISNQHKAMLRNHQMRISMCESPQQNAYAERINGILKNDYFYADKLTQSNVHKRARRVQQLYNIQRPHEELNHMTPTDFEQFLQKTVEKHRPKLQIYQWNGALSTDNQVVNKEKSSKKETSPDT